MSNHWAEITGLEHDHGGVGWGLGVCLWSPTKNSVGRKTYEEMSQPSPGDIVFHLVRGVEKTRPKERFLLGVSKVKSKCETRLAPPPKPGDWADRDSYYRIDLEDYSPLQVPVSLAQIEEALSELILEDLEGAPKFYPYMKYKSDARGFRGRQGAYLAKLTPGLAEAFADFLGAVQSSGHRAAASKRMIAQSFAEGEAIIREVRYFRRNPNLRQDAIDKYGLTCAACEKSMTDLYGEAAEGLIDIHHLKPLSMGKRGRQTTLEDVRPLCPNCHRVAHKKRPEPYSIKELREMIKKAAQRRRQ